jgi:hypothetical protein
MQTTNNWKSLSIFLSSMLLISSVNADNLATKGWYYYETPPVLQLESQDQQMFYSSKQLLDEGIYDVKTSRPTSDKRSRLALTTHLIQTGRILFPRHGAEELINQIVNFGVEKHDDLADAFSILILNCIEEPQVTPRITYV